MRIKLEALEDVEEVFDTLKQDTEYTDKEMKAVVRKLDYIKKIKEESKNTRKYYANLKNEHTLLIERFGRLNLRLLEMEKTSQRIEE